MLKDMIYEMLMKATNFVKGTAIAEEFIDMEKSKPRRFIVKLSDMLDKALTELLLISLTGGLYLVWKGLKKSWSKRRSKRKEKRVRRKRA